MYSIFDNDTGNYLHTGRNSKTKREAYVAYLYYREPNLGEWWECKDIAPITYKDIKGITEKEFQDNYKIYFWNFCHEVDEKFVLEDMEVCNFSLEEHEEPIEENY